MNNKPHVTSHGQGNPLVLFHGWGFNSQVWSTCLTDLIKYYRVYLVDLPGFGLTPTMDWCDFKKTLLPQLPEQFALLGWSMGGMFATRLAIEAPHRVSHLINVASSPRFIKEADWPGVDRQLFNLFYHQVSLNRLQALEQFIALQMQGQNFASTVLKDHIPSLTGLRAGLDVLMQWDLREAVSSIQLPVLYVFGRLDSITARGIMTKMQVIYPQFNYVMFPKAAHVPFLSHPTEFMEALQEFLI